MARTANSIRDEAQKIGEMAHRNEATDNSCIQVLSALVEELAENVERLEAELQALKIQQSRRAKT
jgi:hypothetical protein